MTQFPHTPGEGHEQSKRLSPDQGDLGDIDSPGYDRFIHMVRRTSEQELSEVFAEAADRVNTDEVRSDILSGDRGGGSFDSTDVAKLARELYSGMVACHGLAFNPADLFKQVPELRHVDPEVMSAEDVANLASWMCQNDTPAFGQAAADLAQREPGLLPHLLGEQALQYAAATLAKRYQGE